MARRHICIVRPEFIAPLLAGDKRIESRFARTRRPPWDCVAPGDVVFFRPVGAAPCVGCRVRRVRQFSDLSAGSLTQLRREFGLEICAGRGYWARCRGARFGVLVWLSQPIPLKWNRPWTRAFGGGWQIVTE